MGKKIVKRKKKTRTVFTPEILEKIKEYASLGYPQRKIEEVLGLKQDSLSANKYANKKRGNLDIVEAFTCAREAFIKKHLENIGDWAIEKDWRPSKYLLSITEPQHFSEKKRLEMTGEGGQPVEVQIVKHYGGEKKK